jgi:NADH:ubiquinone reductase (H+-translocating)
MTGRDDPSAVRHRVVVVGGGFGGLPATRLLARSHVDVTLIDRRNHHLFQPLLYQVATGILSPGQISPVLRHIFRKRRNVRVELAEVTGFDLERRVVHAKTIPGNTLEFPYDSLIVAAGAGQSYFGHDEYALIAPGMKTIDDALELRRRIYGAFELAESTSDENERRDWLTVAVVGAGPTGVELAGQVRELAARSLRRDFRSVDPSTVRVVLLDGGEQPLASFGDRLSGRAARELEKMGVELRMRTRVVGVDAMGVDVEGPDGKERISAHTVIWAAGVQASPLAKMLADATGAEIDRSGRVAVQPDLSLAGHPEVFAVGDMASINGLPGVCEVALQGGLHAANRIRRRLEGDTREVPFRYRDVGSAASVGRFKAIVSVRGLHLGGFPGWVVWLFVHITFLNGFANRAATLWRWARAMIGRSRPERVFSVGHTGGDLSLPDAVRAEVMPSPFPVVERMRSKGDDHG